MRAELLRQDAGPREAPEACGRLVPGRRDRARQAGKGSNFCKQTPSHLLTA